MKIWPANLTIYMERVVHALTTSTPLICRVNANYSSMVSCTISLRKKKNQIMDILLRKMSSFCWKICRTMLKAIVNKNAFERVRESVEDLMRKARSRMCGKKKTRKRI